MNRESSLRQPAEGTPRSHIVGSAGLALLLGLGIATILCSGCKRHPKVVPVAGRVLYNGNPLPFGTVMFQSDKGQPAFGEIQPDGSFQLSSYAPNDGAVPGHHAVSITCYEGQRPGQSLPDGGEVSMGRLLIPLKYTRLGSSGLTADIEDVEQQSVEFPLKGPPVRF